MVLDVGIAAFNFDWLLWRTKPCMHVGGSFLVSAGVPNRCLSSPFSPSFLINSYLLSNFLSIVTFIVSCEWILLELQSFEFF